MSAARGFSEDSRQLLHMAMGALALLMRALTWWQAATIAALAVAFNAYVLPHLAGERLFRPHEGARRLLSGIVLYPAAVLLLILVLPHRPDIVAAAWGTLAVGDGMATIVGRRARRRLPWNREKSVEGTLAFMLLGGLAGAFLAWWCRPAVMPVPGMWFSLGAPLLAAIAAGLVETIPIRLDDNLSVPATAAAVLWWLSLVSADGAAAAWVRASPVLPLAIAVNAVAASLAWQARTVSAGGAVTGAVLGTVVVACAGWSGWILLDATFAAAVVSSRLGLRRKTLLGIAEPRGGRRGGGNAIANTGVAAAAAVLAATSPATEPSLVAFVTALAAGGSDTIASEIGKAWGRGTYLVPSLREVPPGTTGAVSVEGTAAGILGAFALGALGMGLGLVPGTAIAAVVIGATAGSIIESTLGATFEAPGIVNNDVLNFLNTAASAAVAVVLVKTF